jgi:hypothetical protein
MLLLTGMRHGTEAMGICWRHIEWHTDKGDADASTIGVGLRYNF